jgi:hypothetical protein
VIAVMMRHKSDIELRGQVAGGNRWSLNLLIRAQIQIGPDQKVARLNEPACIADPSHGNSFTMGPNFIEKREARPAGLRPGRCCDGEGGH